MLASLFARRYLFSPKSRSVINLIAALSVVAVAVPVAAMVILLSVVNGFDGLIRANHSHFDADLRITPREGQTFEPAKLDTVRIARTEGVAALSVILEQQVLLEHDGAQLTTTLRGVDDRYGEVIPYREMITLGEGVIRQGDLDYLLIGETTWARMGLRSMADADLTLYAIRRGGFSSLMPIGSYVRRTLPVKGLFRIGYADETAFVLAPLRVAQQLFDRKERASALLIRCDDGYAIKEVQRALQRELGEQYLIENRDERNASFYRLVQLEKWGIFFIALLVLAVASFSVVGALSMLIIEKRQDRQTLRAMGATEPFIRSIFRREGMLICLVGGVLGLTTGIVLCLVQQHVGVIGMPTAHFITKSYPVELRPSDLVPIVGAFAAVAWAFSTLTVRSMIKHEE